VALLVFREDKNVVLFHDFKVVCQGADLTPWITNNITISLADRTGVNTASFDLDNALDRFVITAENLGINPTTYQAIESGPVWRPGPAYQNKYSEDAKKTIYDYKKGKISQKILQDAASLLKAQVNKIKASNTKSKNSTDQQVLQTALENTLASIPDSFFTDPSDSGGSRRAQLQDRLVTDMTSPMVVGNSTQQSKGGKKDKAIQRLTEGIDQNTASQMVFDGMLSRTAGTIKANKTNPYEAGKLGQRVPSIDIDKLNPQDENTLDYRWPLFERSTVFHKNDPVRIFVHNPYTEDDQWLPAFTGYIDTYPKDVDDITSRSTIKINCHDIKAIMQKMRVQLNPNYGLINAAALFGERLGIFNDLIYQNHWIGGGNLPANTPVEDAVAEYLTGYTYKGSPAQKSELGQRINAVGGLKLGLRVTYPTPEGMKDPTNPTNKTVLENWHTLGVVGLSLGVSKTTLDAAIGNEEVTGDNFAAFVQTYTGFYTSSQIAIIQKGTTSDGDFRPDNAFVHFLLPAQGTGNREFTDKSFDVGTRDRDWTNRYAIINEAVGRFDYEWNVRPNGDIAIEFPMWDFDPSDFGAWAPLFTVDNHLRDHTVQDESSDIVTGLVCYGGHENKMASNQDSQAPQEVVTPVVILVSPTMAARAGITIEQVTYPFIDDIKKLQNLGLLEFQKKLSNCNSFNCTFAYRPMLLPNRPILCTPEKRMGTTTNISTTIQLFQMVGTQVSMRYIRSVRADGTYRLITGGTYLPISFKSPFAAGDAGSTTRGIVAHLPQDRAGSQKGELFKNQTKTKARTPGTGGLPGVTDPRNLVQNLKGETQDVVAAVGECAQAMGKDITVTCGRRTNAQNEQVGGCGSSKGTGSCASSQSFHLSGKAFDVHPIDQFSKPQRDKLGQCAWKKGYYLLDEVDHFHFQPSTPKGNSSGALAVVCRRFNVAGERLQPACSVRGDPNT
jgi:hypothetical protein